MKLHPLIATVIVFFGTFQWVISSQNDSIINTLRTEIRTAREIEDLQTVVQKEYALGNIYADHYLNAKAIESFNDALFIYRSLKTDTLSVKLKNELGKIYLSMNNYATAYNYFQDALRSASGINYSLGEANSLSLIGSVFEKQGDYLKALKSQKRSLEVFNALEDDFGIAKVNENIGSIYEDLEQFDMAYRYFSEAYQLLKDTNTFEEADVLNNLGDVYRKQGRYEESLVYTKQALDLALALDNGDLLESAYKDLSKAHNLLGNNKMAYEYRVISEEYKERILTNQNVKQLNVLRAVYDSDQKEAEIQLLREKNKVSEGNQKLLVAILISGLLILGLVSYFLLKKRNAQRKLLAYKERALQAELEQKQIKEALLQRDIKVKSASLTKYSLSVSRKNKMLSDVSLHLKNLADRKHIDFSKNIKKLSQEIDFSLHQENEWIEFNSLFSDIHPDFSKKLLQTAKDKLSSTEIKLAMLLRLNLSSKEIASIMHVTPDSVRVARYRLRKKLPIASKKELVNFMLEL